MRMFLISFVFFRYCRDNIFSEEMDIISHSATGIFLSLAFSGEAEKTACIVGALIPDIFLAPIYVKIFHTQKTWKLIHFVGHPEHPLHDKFFWAYWMAHSFVPVFLIFLGAFFFQNSVLLAFGVGVFSHLLLDIPTHTKDFACRPFFPFSSYAIEGFYDWWKTKSGKILMFCFWIFSVILSFFLWK